MSISLSGLSFTVSASLHGFLPLVESISFYRIPGTILSAAFGAGVTDTHGLAVLCVYVDGDSFFAFHHATSFAVSYRLIVGCNLSYLPSIAVMQFSLWETGKRRRTGCVSVPRLLWVYHWIFCLLCAVLVYKNCAIFLDEHDMTTVFAYDLVVFRWCLCD